MRKIGFWEALKRDNWLPKYVLPAFGVFCIILALITPVKDTFILWLLGGISLFVPFCRARNRSSDLVECPGREEKECKRLIYKWGNYCPYCGRENDLKERN